MIWITDELSISGGYKFMTEKEILHVLQAIDNFLCEEDENFDKNDSQL